MSILETEALSTIEEVLDDVKRGRMIVLVDAEDRENEGDLVIPAEMANSEVINFMAQARQRPHLPGVDRATCRGTRLAADAA